MDGSALPIGSPTSGSRPLADEREMQPEPLPGRIFNSTIAAEGRQNVAEKGHSFSERREAEMASLSNADILTSRLRSFHEALARRKAFSAMPKEVSSNFSLALCQGPAKPST